MNNEEKIALCKQLLSCALKMIESNTHPDNMKQYKEEHDKILQNEKYCIYLIDNILSDFVITILD